MKAFQMLWQYAKSIYNDTPKQDILMQAINLQKPEYEDDKRDFIEEFRFIFEDKFVIKEVKDNEGNYLIDLKIHKVIEERENIARENAIRQAVEQKYKQQAQNGGFAKRDKSLPGRAKVQAIKPMFLKYFNPNLNPHKIAIIIENELISINSNPPSIYHHLSAIKGKLDGNLISKQDFINQRKEIITKFASKYNIQLEGVEVLLEYITMRDGDIRDLIYDYCRELWKVGKM